MMAAAAAAIGVVLGQEIKISPPETRVIDDPGAEDEHLRLGPPCHLHHVHDRR